MSQPATVRRRRTPPRTASAANVQDTRRDLYLTSFWPKWATSTVVLRPFKTIEKHSVVRLIRTNASPGRAMCGYLRAKILRSLASLPETFTRRRVLTNRMQACVASQKPGQHTCKQKRKQDKHNAWQNASESPDSSHSSAHCMHKSRPTQYDHVVKADVAAITTSCLMRHSTPHQKELFPCNASQQMLQHASWQQRK